MRLALRSDTLQSPTGFYAIGVLLWFMLWGGLSARLDPTWAGRFVDKLHCLRAFFPLLAGAIAWFIWLAGRPLLWPAADPVSLIGWYGLLGVFTSIVTSPAPAVALYWAGCYLAVVLVLRLWMVEPPSARRIWGLLNVNWNLLAVLGGFFAVFALRSLEAFGRSSLHGMTNLVDVPVVLGISMVRETGIGRYVGVLCTVALARSFFSTGLWRMFWVGVTILTGYLVMLSDARSAILGTAIGCLVVCLCAGRRWVLWALGAAAMLAAVAWGALAVEFLGHFSWVNLIDRLSGRFMIWRSTFALIEDSPLLGFGFHADRLLLQQPFQNHVSNAFLHAFVQAGVVGFCLFVGAWVVTWRAAWQLLGHSSVAALDRALLVEAIGVLAFLSTRAFFESTGAFFGVDLLLVLPVFAAVQTLQAGCVAPRVEGSAA